MKADYFEFSTFIMSYYNIARKNCQQKKYKILSNIRWLNTIFNNFECMKKGVKNGRSYSPIKKRYYKP